MTKLLIEKETMELALEALEEFGEHYDWCHQFPTYAFPENYPPCNCGYDEVITTIKEALMSVPDGAQQCVCGEPNSAGTHRTDGPCLAPQPQRTWIGLTNDDWDEIFGNALTIGEAIKVTEAKLKAKNFA